MVNAERGTQAENLYSTTWCNEYKEVMRTQERLDVQLYGG